MTKASPAKLKDGSWGARVTGSTQVGDTITITARSGKAWEARVTQVVWSGQNRYSGDGETLVRTQRLDPPPSSGSPTRPGAGLIETCAYCRRQRYVVRLACQEPCPESAVPGSLYETCDRHHETCGRCAGHQVEVSKEEDVAEHKAVEQRKAQRLERAEAQKTKKVERKQTKQDSARAKLRVEELTQGLICTDTHPLYLSTDVVLREDLGGYAGWIRITRDAATGALVQQRKHDSIVRAWGTQEQVDSWALEAAKESGITEEQALSWRSRYGGCAGQRAYDAILREAGHDPENLSPEALTEARERVDAKREARQQEQEKARLVREAEREHEEKTQQEKSERARRVQYDQDRIRRLSGAQRDLLETLRAAMGPVRITPRQRRTLRALVSRGFAVGLESGEAKASRWPM